MPFADIMQPQRKSLFDKLSTQLGAGNESMPFAFILVRGQRCLHHQNPGKEILGKKQASRFSFLSGLPVLVKGPKNWRMKFENLLRIWNFVSHGETQAHTRQISDIGKVVEYILEYPFWLIFLRQTPVTTALDREKWSASLTHVVNSDF